MAEAIREGSSWQIMIEMGVHLYYIQQDINPDFPLARPYVVKTGKK
ncbi:MAG: hypothetical protein ACYDBA_02770 [Sulfuricaulis sp.]